VLGVSEL
jgi:hypothetical protein